jgi:hypothetical protein
MATIEIERDSDSAVDATNREDIRQALLNEAYLRLKLSERGIRFNPEEVKKFRVSGDFGFGGDRRNGLGSFTLPHGINASGALNRWSPYSLAIEDDKPILYDEDERIGEITFNTPNPVLNQTISTGEKFRAIASVSQQGGIHVMYSNECALKDLGEDCLYCGFNVRAKEDADKKVLVKSPKQIAEIYDVARKAGVGNHFRITGGFVPERRELEYYLDVADAIRENYETFYGVAIIGAPGDLSVIHKYKEAGFQNISTNIEVWDKDIFKAMCPGKEKRNGGWKHWLETLEYAVDVFGRGNVHSTLVGGLEPKQSALEGIEYLASKGVVCHFSAFRPVPGTPLEGYRTPEAAWHWDLLVKGTEIYRRYGFSTLQLFSGPASGPHSTDVFRINAGEFVGDKLPVWKFPVLE